MTTPPPTSIRLDTDILRQLDTLAEAWPVSRNTAIGRCIEAAYRQHIDAAIVADTVMQDPAAREALLAAINRALHPNR